jgi:hypothetical protein
LRSRTQPVTIMATNPNAEIYAGGRPVGRGTVTVELPRDQDQTILARTDDNRTGTATIKSHMGSAGIFSIIGGAFILSCSRSSGCWLPGAVILTPAVLSLKSRLPRHRQALPPQREH